MWRRLRKAKWRAWKVRTIPIIPLFSFHEPSSRKRTKTPPPHHVPVAHSPPPPPPPPLTRPDASRGGCRLLIVRSVRHVLSAGEEPLRRNGRPPRSRRRRVPPPPDARDRRLRQLRRVEALLPGQGLLVRRPEGPRQRHHRGPQRQALLLRPRLPQAGGLLRRLQGGLRRWVSSSPGGSGVFYEGSRGFGSSNGRHFEFGDRFLQTGFFVA